VEDKQRLIAEVDKTSAFFIAAEIAAEQKSHTDF
jgi:hypothetical protein